MIIAILKIHFRDSKTTDYQNELIGYELIHYGQ